MGWQRGKRDVQLFSDNTLIHIPEIRFFIVRKLTHNPKGFLSKPYLRNCTKSRYSFKWIYYKGPPSHSNVNHGPKGPADWNRALQPHTTPFKAHLQLCAYILSSLSLYVKHGIIQQRMRDTTAVFQISSCFYTDSIYGDHPLVRIDSTFDAQKRSAHHYNGQNCSTRQQTLRAFDAYVGSSLGFDTVWIYDYIDETGMNNKKDWKKNY